jgi:hypothetical protein
MSRWYVCDEGCGAEQLDPFPFELIQTCADVDEDGDQRVEILHFCSSACLCARAMTLAMDHPEDNATQE